MYCYNVQPHIIIDYSDGESQLDYNSSDIIIDVVSQSSGNEQQEQENVDKSTDLDANNRTLEVTVPEGTTYVFNTNTRRFHRIDCESVGDMKPKNTAYFGGTREEAIEQGYQPCGRCNP